MIVEIDYRNSSGVGGSVRESVRELRYFNKTCIVSRERNKHDAHDLNYNITFEKNCARLYHTLLKDQI